MRRLILLTLALWALASPALAGELLVVQGLRSPLYDEALRGFRSACYLAGRTLVLSDYAEVDLARVIREEHPRLVLAVGDGALAALRRVRDVPVLPLLTLEGAGVSGSPWVALAARPEQYLALMRRLKLKRVGVVLDPARSEWYLRQARAAARQHGVELVLREVHDPRQTLAQLESLKGKVDALWLWPDLTAVNTKNQEAYFLFSQEQSVPVLSFSPAHLKLGALAALEVDRFELGRQTAELALRLLRGDGAEAGPVAPRKVHLRINEAVARRLNYPAELIHALTRK